MNNLRLFLLMLFIALYCASQAQTNLYFINRSKHKIIEVKTGQQLSLKYKGYLGQPEFAKQTVTEITDSFIYLGVDPELLGDLFKKSISNNPKFIYKKVLLKDIIAFRRMTVGRQFFKSSMMIATIFGTGYLLTDLYQKNKFTTLETLGISFGVGIGTSLLINLVLPENPKCFLSDGWEVTTGTSMPKL